MKKEKNQGFTLLELVIVLVIIGILALIALPTYQNMQRSSAINSVVTQWQESFYLAQAEAMRTKRDILLCGSSDGKTCDHSGFEKGWIVLNETDNKVIRDFLPPEIENLSMSLNVDSLKNTLTIRPNGNISGFVGASLTAKITNDEGEELSERVLVISREGRMRTVASSPKIDESDNARWE